VIEMRVIAMVKATPESEAGQMPTPEQLAEMGTFNQQLIDAGVMLSGDGLHPTMKGVRIDWTDGKPTITDGPFAETKEIVSGYWILEVKTFEEAVEWIKRAPFRTEQVELRPIFGPEDFAYDPETIERESQQREQLVARSEG
jgi:hypothetical protein